MPSLLKKSVLESWDSSQVVPAFWAPTPRIKNFPWTTGETIFHSQFNHINKNPSVKIKTFDCQTIELAWNTDDSHTRPDIDQILINFLTQPAGTENHSEAQKNRQTGPCDSVESGFSTACTAEHRAPTCSEPSHSISLRAVKQNEENQ